MLVGFTLGVKGKGGKKNGRAGWSGKKKGVCVGEGKKTRRFFSFVFNSFLFGSSVFHWLSGVDRRLATALKRQSQWPAAILSCALSSPPFCFATPTKNVVYKVTSESIYSVKGIFPYRTHIGKITRMFLLSSGIFLKFLKCPVVVMKCWESRGTQATMR